MIIILMRWLQSQRLQYSKYAEVTLHIEIERYHTFISDRLSLELTALFCINRICLRRARSGINRLRLPSVSKFEMISRVWEIIEII